MKRSPMKHWLAEMLSMSEASRSLLEADTLGGPVVLKLELCWCFGSTPKSHSVVSTCRWQFRCTSGTQIS